MTEHVASLAAHLHTLTQEQIAVLLTARNDTTVEPAPRTMAMLAERLLQPGSLAAALTLLTLPQMQAAEAIAALGDGCTPARLAALLGVPDRDPALIAALADLTALALVWPCGGRLAGDHLKAIWRQPLNLGPSARDLLDARTLPDLRRLAKTLGVPGGRTKAEAVAALATWLTDHDNVRRLAERAPAGERAALDKLAWAEAAPFGIFFGAPPVIPPWAAEHGLVVPSGWNGPGRMPREVALAWRGDDYHAPFDTEPPPLDTAPVPGGAVEREAAAAAGTTLAAITAVVESMSRTPVALRKTGGLGVRELRRIARSAGQSEDRTRLIIEVATAGGLVAAREDGIIPADTYGEFAAAEPAVQLLDVVEIWLQMPACPFAPGPPGEPALYWDPDEEALLTGLRAAMLRTLASAIAEGDAAQAGAVPRLLEWHRPVLTGYAGDDLDRFLAGIWREAHEIGLLAHGAPTALCRAMLSGDAEAAHRRAAAMMPQTRSSVLLQADLTAVVTGTPSPGLLSLLDSAADPESRSGAWTWRFGPATVRRALDAGTDPQDLRAQLTEAAEGGRLPQPLAYLIDDVARRHGQVQVRTVGCCLCSDDEGLLNEILRTRSLKALTLVRVAPTVLASGKPPAETLTALRSAGFAPVGTHADGSRAIEVTMRHRSAPPPHGSELDGPVRKHRIADPARLARLLVKNP